MLLESRSMVHAGFCGNSVALLNAPVGGSKGLVGPRSLLKRVMKRFVCPKDEFLDLVILAQK